MELSLALLGGDQREAVVANTLLKKGFSLKIFGLPSDAVIKKEAVEKTVHHAVKNADVLILPVKGVKDDGEVFAPLCKEGVFLDDALLQSLKPDAAVFCGMTSPYLSVHCEKSGLRVVPFMERDSVALLNAVPTAEGALAIAIEKTPITLCGAKVVVLGFGRVGRSVAKAFQSMESRVSVLSRNEKELTEGRKLGYDMRQYHGLLSLLPHADVVINTVPALILGQQELRHMGKNTLVIDLASSPGGVDFKAAKELSVSVVHALGLPGIYAPLTAGKIYAAGILEVLDALQKGRW